MEVTFFATPAEFRAWLASTTQRAGLWVGFPKKKAPATISPGPKPWTSPFATAG